MNQVTMTRSEKIRATKEAKRLEQQRIAEAERKAKQEADDLRVKLIQELQTKKEVIEEDLKSLTHDRTESKVINWRGWGEGAKAVYENTSWNETPQMELRTLTIDPNYSSTSRAEAFAIAIKLAAIDSSDPIHEIVKSLIDKRLKDLAYGKTYQVTLSRGKNQGTFSLWIKAENENEACKLAFDKHEGRYTIKKCSEIPAK